MKRPEDGILINAPHQLHALSRDMEPVEDVESLIHHVQTENRHGDVEYAPDDPGLDFDPIALALEIQNGGSW